MSDDLDICRQYAAKALNDLLNVENNLKADRVPLDTVCFHCQQAAEKLLKAYLAAQGQSLPFSHDLLLLLERVKVSEPSIESLREDLILLMPYGVEVRYPADWFMPSEQDATEAQRAANHVLLWFRSVLPNVSLNCGGT